MALIMLAASRRRNPLVSQKHKPILVLYSDPSHAITTAADFCCLQSSTSHLPQLPPPYPRGSQQAFLTGLAHLYNLVPYQRRAQHAGQCGVEVEGGKVPTRDWFLNLQILTSGGFR